MNSKTIQQLVQFLSTTVAVAIGAIIAITYTTWEEEKKPPKPLIIHIDNWREMAEKALDEFSRKLEEEEERERRRWEGEISR